jgi:tRNA(fMet)-specific endonuclease VapC
MICLDANVVIAALNNRPPLVLQRVAEGVREGWPLAVSTIVLFELYFGAAKSAFPERNARRIAEFASSTIQVLEFDAEDSAEAGEIRNHLKRAGTPIGPYDVLIAAQARRRGALLVTANVREFARVPGLRLDDWTKPTVGRSTSGADQ